MRDGVAVIVEPRMLLLATGASERPCPLPGWTLPGVMTTGGLQTLVRAQRTAPGQRIVIAGSGPLNLQAACELLKLGIKPAAVIDSGPGPSPAGLRSLLRMARADAGATWQGLLYMARLAAARVPIHWRSTVNRIEGDGKVRSIVMERNGRQTAIACDVVALNMGFQPQAELARQIGCRLRYAGDHVGAVSVETDRNGRTSLPNVFAIGDGAAIGGAKIAMARARLAAVAIGQELSLALPDQQSGEALDRAERFQSALWTLFTQPAFEAAKLADETIVCRCEEVGAGAARKACREGTPTLATVKRLTRAGMGRCQGRFCAGTLSRIVESEGGPAPDVTAFFAPRPPARARAAGRHRGREARMGRSSPVPAGRDLAARRDATPVLRGGRGRCRRDRRRRRRLYRRLGAGAGW